ncbi:MAG: hypothetical protein C0467_31495 [Planctomycetaceae bacterium]|nr:hypothetical protein [Planctomycetaceae bacterium]
MARSKADQVAAMQKAHDISKAMTGLMKTQLSILNEQIAKSRASAQHFGGLDSTTQDALVQAARRYKEGGRENVTDAELSLLQSSPATQGLVAKRSDEDAQANPMYKELERLTGMRDRQDTEAEAKKLTAEINMKVQWDEQKLADNLSAAFKRMDFETLFTRLIEVKVREIKAGAERKRSGETN